MKPDLARCAAAVVFAMPLAAFAHSMTFEGADTNRDGMISRAEWNAAAAHAASGGTAGVSVERPPLPQRDIEERSKGAVHEPTAPAASGGPTISVERPPLPARDIEERSKGAVHQPANRGLR